MALELTDLTPEWLAEKLHRNRDLCLSEMEQAETDKARRDWASQLVKAEKLISRYGLEDNINRR